jgi:hypothetical protein
VTDASGGSSMIAISDGLADAQIDGDALMGHVRDEL